MNNYPGKSRAELDKDYEELKRKVEEDMKVWSRPPNRRPKMDATDGFALGFLLGAFLIYVIIK